jgi:hypothetical protein
MQCCWRHRSLGECMYALHWAYSVAGGAALPLHLLQPRCCGTADAAPLCCRYYLQGDKSMNSRENLLKRNALRYTSPLLRAHGPTAAPPPPPVARTPPGLPVRAHFAMLRYDALH